MPSFFERLSTLLKGSHPFEDLPFKDSENELDSISSSKKKTHSKEMDGFCQLPPLEYFIGTLGGDNSHSIFSNDSSIVDNFTVHSISLQDVVLRRKTLFERCHPNSVLVEGVIVAVKSFGVLVELYHFEDLLGRVLPDFSSFREVSDLKITVSGRPHFRGGGCPFCIHLVNLKRSKSNGKTNN